MEGQPAELMGIVVEQQLACLWIWRRSGKEASRKKKKRRGPPFPRQHEPRSTNGAYSFFLILLVLF